MAIRQLAQGRRSVAAPVSSCGAWLSRMAAAALAFAVLATPTLVWACSVCTAGRDEENQTAFLLSTLFMSLLPLIAIGSIVYFIWRRVQKLEEDEAARRLKPATPAPALREIPANRV